MTARGPAPRTAGWVLAGTAATALLCGAAAVALAAEWQEPVLFVDLGALPPSAPAVAAVAESAPQVVDEAPVALDEPAPAEEAPDLPEADVAPELAAASPVALPVPETPVQADLALPPPPEKPEPKVEEKPVEKPKPKPEPEKKKVKEKAAEKPKKTETAEDKPKETKKEKAAASASASAATTGSKAKKGGAVSPAAYAKSVMKKVRSTKKKTVSGANGTAVVNFTIAADGSLAGVSLAQSSGNAALDKIALDHIRRSAPFPAPPEGVKPTYAWTFVGK